MNTLLLYCKYTGQQGGTLTQAVSDFNQFTMDKKDSFCNQLMRAIDDKKLDDIVNAKLFFNARTTL